MNIYEEQARWFRNIALVDPRIRASLHVEDKEDVRFWDYHLQQVAQGQYNFIFHSRSKKGKDTRGCEQCLNYRHFLSKDFFICIDSDLRLLRGETDLTASNYIAQTYTYSWENHCCESNHLQARLRERMAGIDSVFDFRIFFRKLSEIMYKPFKLLIYYDLHDHVVWNLRKFNACIPLQPSHEQLEDNGKKMLDVIQRNFNQATEGLSVPEGFSINIDKTQTYLHVQGHHIYDLTLHIGTMLCKGKRIAFHTEILNKEYPGEGYSEINCLKQDLEYITKQ